MRLEPPDPNGLLNMFFRVFVVFHSDFIPESTIFPDTGVAIIFLLLASQYVSEVLDSASKG
jgi:hypothetical protein